jgi:hypothetical protein
MKKRYLDGTQPVPKIPDFPIGEWLAVDESLTLSNKIHEWVSMVSQEAKNGEDAGQAGGNLDQVITLLDDMCLSLGWVALDWKGFCDCVRSVSPIFCGRLRFTGNENFIVGIVKRLVIPTEPNLGHLELQLRMIWLMHCMKIGLCIYPQNWVNGILVDAGETELYFLNRFGRYRSVKSTTWILAANLFDAVRHGKESQILVES